MTRETTRQIAEECRERWPEAFPKRGEVKIPLAEGIHEILAAELSSKWSLQDIRTFLAKWTGKPLYLAAMVDGADRVDLNGRPVGRVTGTQADLARALYMLWFMRRIRHMKACGYKLEDIIERCQIYGVPGDETKALTKMMPVSKAATYKLWKKRIASKVPGLVTRKTL